jgi:hypothetical protein
MDYLSLGEKRFRTNTRLFKIKNKFMASAEQLIQFSEVISNLVKDISNVEESKKTASPQDLPELEQYQLHLENTLQELKVQLQNQLSEK